MDCDLCGQKATVFLTQLVEGKMKKMSLCEKCAKEQGVTDPTGFALADMLLGEGAGEDVPVSASSSAKSCPECGFTMADLKRVRRFGCPACYRVFHAEVESMLRGGMHAGNRHAGKAPKGQVERHERKKRLAQLHKQLDRAVAVEDYEKAAGLRDEIREIEAQSASA